MAVRPANRKLAPDPDLCACSRTSACTRLSPCAPVPFCWAGAGPSNTTHPAQQCAAPLSPRRSSCYTPRSCLVLKACLMTLTAFADACQPRHVLPGLHTHDLSSIRRGSCLREHNSVTRRQIRLYHKQAVMRRSATFQVRRHEDCTRTSSKISLSTPSP